MDDGLTRERWIIRLLALGPGLALVATGLWAVAAPRSWFDSFPGSGHTWVSVLGPYDAHLATDAGAGLLTLGVLLCWAGVALDRRLLQMAAVAQLVFGIPHLIYHVRSHEALGPLDNALNLASLSLLIAVPSVLLVWSRRLVTR